MITVNKANPTPGEITSSLTGSTGDGAGLHFEDGGYVDLTNSAAAEYGTSDFSLEFVLNQTEQNSSANYIYFSHTSGPDRFYVRHTGSDTVILTFRDASDSGTQYTINYGLNQNFGTPTHYVLTCNRDGDATLYANGNSVGTVDISGSSSVDIGATNSSVGRIGSTSTIGVLGTFYRFRAFNTLADAKLLFERADVPQTLTANLLFDLDLAFANPTQSLTVQDRKGNTDGTASTSGVTQVQPVVQLNSTSARIGTTAATPADGEVVANVVKSVDGSDYIKIDADTGQVAMYRTGNYIDFLKSGSTFKIRGPGYADFLTISSTGAATFEKSDGAIVNLYRNDPAILDGNTFGRLQALSGDDHHTAGTEVGSIVFKAYGDQTGTRPKGQMRFQVANNTTQAEAMRIEPDKKVRFFGDVQLSNVASAAATSLDGYEEGTFTVTNNGDTSGVLSSETGEYTRIGNCVFIRVVIRVGTTFTSNRIAGLPFGCVTDGGTSSWSPIGTALTSAATNAPILVAAQNGVANLSFFKQANATTPHYPSSTSEDYYRISGYYYTTDAF